MRLFPLMTGAALAGLALPMALSAQTTPPDATSPAPGAAGSAMGGVSDSPVVTEPNSDMPSSTTPPMSGTMPSTSMPATGATGSMTSATTGAQAPADPARMQAAEQAIEKDWGRYDTAGRGELTPLEFGTWMMARQGQDMATQVERSRKGRQANLPATRVLNATAADFSRADSNRDGKVSRDELRQYLAG